MSNNNNTSQAQEINNKEIRVTKLRFHPNGSFSALFYPLEDFIYSILNGLRLKSKDYELRVFLMNGKPIYVDLEL